MNNTIQKQKSPKENIGPARVGNRKWQKIIYEALYGSESWVLTKSHEALLGGLRKN